MHIVKIPKGKGKVRTIYVPNKAERAAFRLVSSQIEKKARRACPEGVCHGFTRGKSPVSNAQAHVGHEFTTCFDLKDFFDSVQEKHLQGKLTKEEIAVVLVDGAPRQGLPTSPAVANLAASNMDKAILAWIDKTKFSVVYTRYADDLSFSYDDPAITERLLKEIPLIVGRCGFKINPDKTRTQYAKAGRRVITGVAVDHSTVHPTREMKRRLRAAEHQKNKDQARGLAEWCKVKPPKDRTQFKESTLDEIGRLLQAWRLGKVPVEKLPHKKDDEDLGAGCVVTGDPVYMLGMSDWTTGWKSCMTHGNSKYHRGVIFWTMLRGTRIAALLDERTKSVAKVERRMMRARCLVHELRNGVKVFDRRYGCDDAIAILEEQLRKAGYISVEEARGKYRDEAVVGHVGRRIKPYFDRMRHRKGTASDGHWKGHEVTVVIV